MASEPEVLALLSSRGAEPRFLGWVVGHSAKPLYRLVALANRACPIGTTDDVFGAMVELQTTPTEWPPREMPWLPEWLASMEHPLIDYLDGLRQAIVVTPWTLVTSFETPSEILGHIIRTTTDTKLGLAAICSPNAPLRAVIDYLLRFEGEWPPHEAPPLVNEILRGRGDPVLDYLVSSLSDGDDRDEVRKLLEVIS